MVKDIKVVIGANYGDEGKGLMTDYLASKAWTNGDRCLVVLTNGGAQRGHTVVTPEGIEHVFHHVGSGFFSSADTYIPSQFIINPIVFRKEYEELKEKWLKLWPNSSKPIPKIFFNPECLVSTPYDMIANMIIEDERGNNRHGSCGMGIWETIKRSNMIITEQGETLTLSEMSWFTEYEFVRYMKSVRDKYYNYRITIPTVWKDIWYSDELIKHFYSDYRYLYEKFDWKFDKDMLNYDNVIFENAQGLLLDESLDKSNHHTTPSRTGLEYVSKILSSADVPAGIQKEIIFVTRSYITKHGAGEINNDFLENSISPFIYDTVPSFVKLADETNVTNQYQGELKYGRMDWESLIDRINTEYKSKDNYDYKWHSVKKSLAVTHCDESDILINYNDFKKYGFNTIYKNFGRTRNDVNMLLY